MNKHFQSRAGKYHGVQRFVYADDFTVKRSRSKTGGGCDGYAVA